MNILQATGVALILLAAASHPHAANAASAEAQNAAAPANSVQPGAVKDVQVLRKAFVHAEHALGA
ncbi:MAG TPA: hypothetical protein VFV74_09975 [Burkholderiales bacterium]|nr:hypothetical protein [Burkholderiales bacterium]